MTDNKMLFSFYGYDPDPKQIHLGMMLFTKNIIELSKMFLAQASKKTDADDIAGAGYEITATVLCQVADMLCKKLEREDYNEDIHGIPGKI